MATWKQGNPNETHRLNCSVLRLVGCLSRFAIMAVSELTLIKQQKKATTFFLFSFLFFLIRSFPQVSAHAVAVAPLLRHQSAPPGWQLQRQRAQSKRTDLLRGLVARPGVRRGPWMFFSGDILTLCDRLGAQTLKHAHDGGATHPAGAECGWGEQRLSVKAEMKKNTLANQLADVSFVVLDALCRLARNFVSWCCFFLLIRRK